MPQIVVVGSLNMDLVVRVERIPSPGETVVGGRFFMAPGGKGANQAVAAARLGADVRMVGQVGADAFGQQLLDNLRHEGVDMALIGIDPVQATGVALITVDGAGQNSIAVASGANFTLGRAHVERALEQIGRFDLLVMPLETPPETISAAAEFAQKAGARVILNPAPARPLLPELLQLVDVLVPNEHEAAQLAGIDVKGEDEARQAALQLLELGVGSVVLTLGARGALILDGSTAPPAFTSLNPHQVDVVDTTAAGDAFVAALAVGLGEGKSLAAAATFANTAGALAVTRQGAQPAMPRRVEVDHFLGGGNVD